MPIGQIAEALDDADASAFTVPLGMEKVDARRRRSRHSTGACRQRAADDGLNDSLAAASDMTRSVDDLVRTKTLSR